MVDFGSGIWLFKGDSEDFYTISIWLEEPVDEEAAECMCLDSHYLKWDLDDFMHKEKDEVQISDWPLTSWRKYD